MSDETMDFLFFLVGVLSIVGSLLGVLYLGVVTLQALWELVIKPQMRG